MNPACEQANCVCASVPGWPKEIYPGWITHLHIIEPHVAKERE